MEYHSNLHEALRVEKIAQHSGVGLEYIAVRLQRGKNDIRYSLHARPTFYTMSGGLTQADLLHRLGFASGRCTFVSGDECLAKEIPADFDVPRFAATIERAFSDLQAALKHLFACGFYVEHTLFRRRLPPVVQGMLDAPRTDGHNAPQMKQMKKAEDETFDYRCTWIDGGTAKGWTFHYRPKHALSVEVASLLAFLELEPFPECPEYDFEECSWRFCNFVDTGDPFHGVAELAHGWFDAHAANFSAGLQKLLDAHATLATFGFELLPRVKANVPPEIVQPPKANRRSVKPTLASANAANDTVFDVAISFAGVQREFAEAIATIVRQAGFDVFYDAFFPEQLWGKDLPVFFDDVFRKQSRYCLIVVSKEYIERDWTNHERRSAVARAIKERGREYILPLKVDKDVELPGVPDSIGYISLDEYSVQQVAEMLIKKLKGK